MSQPLRWVEATIDNLTAVEFHHLMKLRVDVFVVEQACIYPELDGQDALKNTYHVFAVQPDVQAEVQHDVRAEVQPDVRAEVQPDVQANTKADGDSNGQVIAAARVLASDATHPVRIGRVVVAPEHRGTGLADELMARVMRLCESKFPKQLIELSAQVGVEGLYQRHGFTVVSDEYLEDGIPHWDMRRDSDLTL